MRWIARLVTASIALSAVTPARAQRVAAVQFVGWEPAVGPGAVLAGSAAADTARVRSGDHRVEGAVIGGVLLGALGALLGNEICQGGAQPAAGGGDSSCNGATIGSGLIGAIIGGTIGYFIGKSTPKYRGAPSPQ
jgi:hypothetical protein